MQKITRRVAFKGIVAGGIATAGTLMSRTAFAGQQTMAMPASLVFHGRGFSPMTAHITAGESLEVVSASNAALHLTSGPTAPTKIQSTVAAGGKASLHFVRPGLYLLYDAVTTRFDKKVGQVAAKKTSPAFPLPAYLIVLVTDRNGRGLSPTAAAVTIPDSTMTFTPWTIVVGPGQPISFTNNDEDLHMVMPSPEPMLMSKRVVDTGQSAKEFWLNRMNLFAPLTLKGNGGKGVLTISQPGLHHYYCPVHAAYDSSDYTFAPLKAYGGYPFVQDGVIVVQPT